MFIPVFTSCNLQVQDIPSSANLGAQNRKAVNQMAATSRESESFGPLSRVFGQTSCRRERSRHSLSKTESPPVERIIAQILMPVREIAARRESAFQELALTKRVH